MFDEDIWINVAVYGPQAEIDRLRELCAIIDIDGATDEPVVDFSALMPGSPFACEFYTSNMVSRGPHDPCTLDFGFDISGSFPEEIFAHLAAEFPTLAFYCSAIGSSDEFMARGWYNGPPGSPKLEYRDVPEDYWDTCGASATSDKDEADHDAIVETLIEAARAQKM